MASLEWPPYTGANLPDQGETIKHAKAIFASMGYTLKVDFFPWARVVNLGLGDKTKYVGYLPEYFDQSLAEKCEFSASVGFSPLGFAQLKSNAVKWRNLNDIAKLKGVGVVRDYLNSPDLDARIASGNIRADLAVSDIENIKKLGANRIPLIVIDENVFNYWLDNNSELMGLKHIMEMNPRMLDKKNLYLCFKKDKKSSEIRDIFNKGLNAQRMK
jgi:polar amino acid transport system substrate-binding protein